MSEFYQPLREALALEPKNLREMLGAIDTSHGKIDECFVDSVLGIPRFPGQGREFPDSNSARASHGFFEFVYEGTPYNVIRDILHTVRPTKDDTVYDIGSGYGRFCLYGALTSEATFKGIEAIEKRHEKAVEIKDNFKIPNVDFINENVLEAGISDGTIFYLFNPFYPDIGRTQTAFEAMLRQVAKDHPVTVVTACLEGRFPLRMKQSFEKVEELGTKRIPVEIFRSTHPTQITHSR